MFLYFAGYSWCTCIYLGVKAQVSDSKYSALCQQITEGDLLLDKIYLFMPRKLKTYLEMPGKDGRCKIMKGRKLQTVILPIKLT